MKWKLNIDLRGGRAVRGGSFGATRRGPDRMAMLSRRETKGVGSLSAHLQSDIGIVQTPADNVPRVTTEEWWRWPALGR